MTPLTALLGTIAGRELERLATLGRAADDRWLEAVDTSAPGVANQSTLVEVARLEMRAAWERVDVEALRVAPGAFVVPASS